MTVGAQHAAPLLFLHPAPLLFTSCAPSVFALLFLPVIHALGRRSISAIESAGRFGQFLMDTGRGLSDVRTWARLVMVQMRRIGVDSLPVALFIAAFTGVVL